MAKKCYVGVENTYKILDYIESSGTQYIDTGFKPTGKTRVVLSGYNSSSSSKWVFGSWHTWYTNEFGFNFEEGSSAANGFRYGAVSAGVSGVPLGDFYLDHNGTSYTFNDTHGAMTEQQFTSSYSMYLFRFNAAGSASSGYFVGRIYYCQIYDNGTLVRDYVPCKNDSNNYGLYDKVNGVFYGNKGTGSFAAGSETGETIVSESVARKIKKGYIGVENFTKRALPDGYTQVAYIESTGTQYFDTGFVPVVGTQAEVDFQATATPTSNWWILSAVTSGTVLWRAGVNASTFRTDGGFTYNQTVSLTGRTIATGTCSVNMSIPLYLFAQNESGAVEFGKLRLYSCRIYNNGTMVRDYVPCTNASNVAGLYDMVNGTFSGSATSTAFVAGSSVQSVARKIKKAYIGIGGVARPCWAGGEPTYYGTVTAPNTNAYYCGALNIGNYAVFAGGYRDRSGVTAYDTSLSISYPTELSVGRWSIMFAKAGEYGVFAGGSKVTVASNAVNTVDAYNPSLVRTIPSVLPNTTSLGAAGSIAGNALFAGGYISTTEYTSDVICYNSSLTRSTITDLSSDRHSASATNAGDYLLIAGGGISSSTRTTSVNAYSASLTRTTPTALSSARYKIGATTNNNRAIFAGGYASTAVTTVDSYNESLTRSTLTSLSAVMYGLAAATVDGFSFIGGGLKSSSSVSNVVNYYDSNLTRTIATNLSENTYAVSPFVATNNGNYAMFAGSHNNSGRYSTMDVYAVI